MGEALLVLVGAAWLLAPFVLAGFMVRQERRRRELEARVDQLAGSLARLTRRVESAAPAPGPARPERPAPLAAEPSPAASPSSPAPPAASVLETTIPSAPASVGATPAPAMGHAPPSPRGQPPLAPTSPPREPPSASRFDWESLVGVRLFSWIAGVALLVAGVSFARWSMEHGWLGPAARTALGAMVGVGVLVGAETRRARAYPVTAQSLAAAGVAILFANVYAAHALWHLLPAAAAFALLALVAAVAVAYSVRRSSLPMALLGLCGGFATPILLSTGEDRPIGLFGYLLLLNAALAWVAHRRRWPVLSSVAMGLTVLYQFGWAARFLGRGNLPVALVVFGLFSAFGFFLLLLVRRRDGDRGDEVGAAVTRWTAILGAVPPVLLALHVASRADLAGAWPLLLGFLLILAAGLALVAALLGPESLHLLGGGCVVATLVALSGRLPGTAWPWILVPILALAAVFLGAPALLDRLGRPFRAEGRYGVLAGAGLLLALATLGDVLPPGAEPLLFLGAWLAILAGAGWVASSRLDGPLLVLAGVLAPWAPIQLAAAMGRGSVTVPLAAAAVFSATVAVAALSRSLRRESPPSAWMAGGATAILLSAQLVAAHASRGLEWPAALLVQGLLLASLLLTAARTGRDLVLLVAAVTTPVLVAAFARDHGPAATLAVAVPLQLLLSLVPAAMVGRGADSVRSAWAPGIASALFLILFRQELHDLGAPWAVGPAALLQAVALVPLLVRRIRAHGAAVAERSRIVVVAGTLLALVTAAIPLQLEDEWITVAWALLCAALAWLHGRLPHRGLLAWIGALALAVVARLALNPAVLHYHPRSGVPVWNFWLYAYGLPAASLLGAARLLRRGDDRVHDALPRLRPVLASLGGLLVFLLLNVEIADYFSTGRFVHLRLHGSLAYDLALTIAWAAFALVLLAAGVVSRSRATRIAAIALLAVTVLKGFLFDLGRLDGLFRVGSFVGLAVSLALVAVVLQRFVLADRGGDRKEEG